MEIYPQRQLAMFLAALFLGACMGGCRMLLLALRTFSGAYLPPERMRARYEKPLPLLHRGVRFARGGTRRVWRATVVFCTDLCFCLCFCVSLIFLLYRYNDGAWRLSVPALVFAGFFLFLLLSRRFFVRANDYLAYFFAAAALYVRRALCLPIMLLVRLLCRFIFRPVQKGWRVACEKRRKAYTAACVRAELALAEQGLLMRKEKEECRKKGSHHWNGRCGF